MTGPAVLLGTSLASRGETALWASSGETAVMAGRTQRRFALCAGFGFTMLALLGLMQEIWHIRGTASGLQRQLRSTSDAFISVLAEEHPDGTAFFSAMNASRCVYLTEAPRKGLRPQIGTCSTGKEPIRPTRFQLPEGNSGLIKVVEDPSLCLDAPGGGLLQLWSCNDSKKSEHLEFTLHPELPGWIGIPHFDIDDTGDAENMDASDLKAVTEHVQELGYKGFSVFKGRAWIKNVKDLTFKDLKFMGTDDPNIFYIRRDTEGDVSIRLTAHPDTCMLAPTKMGESDVGMAPCLGTGTESVSGGAWKAGMVFRAEGDSKPSTGDDNPVQVITPKPALEPAATPSPTPAPPITKKATPSTTPALVEDGEEGGEETAVTKPAEDTGNMNRLIIVLNVENVDYAKLNSKPPLKAKFKDIIQEDVATMAGLERDNVAVELGRGSVQATNTLSVPETSKSDDVRSKLQFETLDKKVASGISKVEGIDDVASGEITVKSYETTGQDTGGGKQLKFPLAILLIGVLVLVAVLVTVFIFLVRGKSTQNASPTPAAAAPTKTEEVQENPDPYLDGTDDGPAENGGSLDSPTEIDRLLGGESHGNEESAVPVEEHEEKQDEVPGSGEEEETPAGGDSQPPVAAPAAAADDDEDDPELKAALAASMQDTQHGGSNNDLNNPFAADGTEVPGANLSGY